MTTDITELAQSLKAAAEKWQEAWGKYDKVEITIAEFIRAAEQYESIVKDPANILALVEALEKARGMEAYWKTQCRGITDHCEELQARIASLESQLKSAENNDIDARCHIAELESRTVTPVNYSENADADHCRKWAWQQVKGEVSTEGWTSGDNANYFGFFCWGWDMRRQYNEQRPINVKLPKTMYTEFDDDDYCREVAVLDRQQVIDCLTDAGIKVEAE